LLKLSRNLIRMAMDGLTSMTSEESTRLTGTLMSKAERKLRIKFFKNSSKPSKLLML